MATKTMTQDLIDLLLADHRAVELELDTFLAKPRSDWGPVWSELKAMLTTHEAAEDEVVYPTLRSIDGSDDVADERQAEQEEAAAKIEAMSLLDTESDEFMRSVQELRDAVLLHAQKEEQTVFPRLRDAVSQHDLDELGQKFEQSKQRTSDPK